MIVAFSPEQAYEVSRAFDASWLMNAALAEAACSKDQQQQEDNDGTQPSKATTTDDDDDDDDDNAEKKSPAKNAKNKQCHANKATFQPCRRYHQMARCARQANNRSRAATRIIEQRTPIHMDDETPESAKMSLDVSGFSPEDITVSVDDYVVSVKGERTNKLGDLFVVDRKFRLDKKTAIVDAVTANFDDGILEVVVPKKVLAGPRTIPIAVTTSTSTSVKSGETDDDDDDDDASRKEDDQTDATTPAEEQDHPEMTFSVETVQEEDKTDGEDEEEHAEAHSGDDGADVAIENKKSKEDEDAWEEVTEE